MKKPFKCPVCGGNGLVANGFYNQYNDAWDTISTIPETCRSCNGSGIVFGEDEIELTELIKAQE